MGHPYIKKRKRYLCIKEAAIRRNYDFARKTTEYHTID